MQGMGAPLLWQKRLGQAHSEGQRGYLPWLWTQHQRMVILHSREAAAMDYESSEFDEYLFPFRKTTIIDKYHMDCANDILYQDP